jgi:hypothetical protein
VPLKLSAFLMFLNINFRYFISIFDLNYTYLAQNNQTFMRLIDFLRNGILFDKCCFDKSKSMKKQQIKLGLIAGSLTLVNWLIVNYMIIEINFLKYLLIEGIWTMSYFIYKRERIRIQP